MWRLILAPVAGIVVAFTLVAVIEMAGHMLHPPPADLDYSNRVAMEAFIATLPTSAFLFVLAAWTIGTFAGAWVAAWMAGRRSLLMAGIVGGLMLIASAANLVMIPHPWWFSVSALVLIPAMIYLASRLAPARP